MKSINKALDLLETLAVNNEIHLSELSGLTKIKNSTANRILSILVKRGYVIHKQKRGKYSLNTKFITIQIENTFNKRLREIAIPFMLKLGNILKENIIFSIQRENYAYILATAETKNVLTTLVEVGAKIPLYCTAQGKIFLSHFSEKEIEKYFQNVELTSETAKTITDPKELRSSLLNIKKEGIAYDDEERYVGIKNIATGIFNFKGNLVASLGIIGPASRLTRDKIEAEMIPELKRCAEEITDSLG